MKLRGLERVYLAPRKPSVFLLSGGIGNQLFQYCLALKVGIEKGFTSTLDHTLLTLSHKSSNQLPSIRRIALPSIDWIDNANPIEHLLARASLRSSSQLSNLYISRVRRLSAEKSIQLFVQSRELFDVGIRPSSKSIYVGSFTSFQYWKEYFHDFLQLINSSLAIYSQSLQLSQESKGSEIVIHARRGDFARNVKTKRLHGVYGINYYLEALAKFSNGLRGVSILSDDVNFARDLASRINAEFPGIMANVPEERDPFLLLNNFSRSCLFIGSNSTFSWWLSNLGESKKRVLPLRWFDEGKYGFNPEEYFPMNTDLLEFPFEAT